MTATIVTAPTVEPATFAEVKSQLRIDIDDDKTLVLRYIRAAREHIENETRRAFMTQTWDATFDYDWPSYRVKGCSRYRIVIPRPPLQSVTYVKYIDINGVQQTLAADQYKVAKADTGEWFIEPAWNVVWPVVRNEIAAVVVRFVAGYGATAATLPEPLHQAILLLVGHFYENREPVNIGQGHSVIELPFSLDRMIFPYRVFY